jgi:hypothetical protein
MVYRLLLLLAFFMLCRVGDTYALVAWESPAQVWQVGARRWDVAEEHRFADWVEQTITPDFFVRFRIAVDCADVPYAVRWIYARIAHLPAAATTTDGRLFGHWSTNFGHLPTNPDWSRDRRFRAALLHVLGETSTRTVPADTYPISINPDSLLAGTVFLAGGHAGIVGHILLDGSMASPIQTWEATVPRKVRKLWQRSYIGTSPNRDIGTGLLRFRWPVYSGDRWTYLPPEKHPFYSVEQYSPGFRHAGELFDEAVTRRIDPTPYDPAYIAGKRIDSLYRNIKERVPLVQDGYRHCRRARCTEDSYLWEMYSTPARDEMIAYEIEHLLKVIKAHGLDAGAIKKTMERMVIPIDDGQTVTLNYVVQNYHWLSHDPGDSIEARWGLKRCEMIHSRMQSSLQDLDFVEQRYRATNPDLADQGRRHHLKDLRWLQAEGRRAGCSDDVPLPRDLLTE